MDEKLGKDNVNRYLDTTILHEVVFKEILGINKEGKGESEYVDYLRGTKDVFALAREENHYQLVFVMRSTPLERVEAVSYTHLNAISRVMMREIRTGTERLNSMA